MLIFLAIIALRIPAELLAAVAFAVDTPENLIAGMATVIAAETAAIGFLVKAYIAQRDKHDKYTEAVNERMITALIENKNVIEDVTDVIKENTQATRKLTGEQSRRNRDRADNRKANV